MKANRVVLPALLLLAVALGVRAWVGAHSIVAKDTYDFVAIGKAIEEDGWAAIEKSEGAGSTTQHPMQPLLALAFHRLGADWIAAAQISSVGFGALSVLAMLGFFRRILPTREAWLAAAMAAVHFNLVRFTCDGRSEGAYLFFVAGALWAAAKAFRLTPPGEAIPPGSFGRDALWAAAAGLFSAGAYWTRPEGLGVALIVCAWAVADRLQRRDAGGVRRIALACVVLCVCAAAALPYILAVGDLTKKKRILWVLTGGAAFLLNPAGARLLAASGDDEEKAVEISVLTLLDTLWHPVWPFFLLGLFLGIGRRIRGGADPSARGDELGWGILAGYLALTQLLALPTVAGYLSDRHMATMLPVALALSARGIFAAADFLGSRAPRLRLAAVLPAAVCLFLAARAVQPRRLERDEERDAGRWILKTLGSDRRIGTNSSRPALYADGRILAKPGREEMSAALERPLDAVVVTSDDLRKHPEWPGQLAAAGYVLAREFPPPEANRGRVHFVQVWIPGQSPKSKVQSPKSQVER